MGVWDTLIGLATTALKERPRKEVLFGLLTLRNAMIDCQKTYGDYQELLKEGDYDSVIEKRLNGPIPAGVKFTFLYYPRECWDQAVGRLVAALVDVPDFPTIFSPGVARHVKRYEIAEEMPIKQRDILISIDAGINIEKVSLSSQCKPALSQLDEVIIKNFKPEEVFFTQKDKIHPFPYPARFCGEHWLTMDLAIFSIGFPRGDC